MKDRRNYYRVLHLQPDAPAGLVRVSYRTLMQKLGAHPDLGGENWSAAHLNAAYATLSDPKRRAAYDRELLSRYGIEVLSEGRPKARPRKNAEPQRAGVNRRTYYRVLQAQRDTPVEVLEANHRALRAEHPEDARLLDDALALLSDADLRQIYDRLLEACDHQNALARMQLELGGSPAYEPLIGSFCPFCKSPHARVEEEHPDALCAECNSPLFPPPRQFLGLARRALTRVSRNSPITLYFDWPAAGIRSLLIDLSPTGMRCETRAPLDLNDVVKIDSQDFSAIGSVAHANRSGSKTTAGMRFLTVGFPKERGNFRSIKA